MRSGRRRRMRRPRGGPRRTRTRARQHRRRRRALAHRRGGHSWCPRGARTRIECNPGVRGAPREGAAHGRMRGMRIADAAVPETPATAAALAVATRFVTPALLEHSIRAWYWAVGFADATGVEPKDRELLA